MTDHDTITQAQAQMNRAAIDLGAMSSDVGDAKQVREFSSDRLKRAFSVAVVEFLDAGDSGVASEHRARASKAYGSSLHDLSEQFRTAMRVIEKYEALKVQFESARSLLSVEKAKLGIL